MCIVLCKVQFQMALGLLSLLFYLNPGAIQADLWLHAFQAQEKSDQDAWDLAACDSLWGVNILCKTDAKCDKGQSNIS